MSKAPKLTFAEWLKEEEKDWVELMDKIDQLRDRIDALLEQRDLSFDDATYELDRSLARLAMKCANYCDDARYVMITEMYRQNPIIKLLYEGKLSPGTTPFTAAISTNERAGEK